VSEDRARLPVPVRGVVFVTSQGHRVLSGTGRVERES
jgi:hypothetical protein